MFGSCLGLKKNLMEPIDSEDGAKTFYMVDGIVPQQGPNYALAKRMQHWMAIVQRGEKHTVRFFSTKIEKKKKWNKNMKKCR